MFEETMGKSGQQNVYTSNSAKMRDSKESKSIENKIDEKDEDSFEDDDEFEEYTEVEYQIEDAGRVSAEIDPNKVTFVYDILAQRL